MEVLILLFVLLLFWAYISWDSERVEDQARAEARNRRKGTAVAPKAVITVPSLLITGVALLAWAAALVLQPPLPPFTGRLSLIPQLLNAGLVQYGPAIATSLAALLCFGLALAAIKKRER
jgi:hypothetical protein